MGRAAAPFAAPGVFAARLVAWQRSHGRHDLPWQGTRDPYRVWLAEIMLQQTQVATVIPYYRRFIDRYPDIAALAAAPVEDVMALWSGLGYYARARNLHRCAATVVERHGGRLPGDPAQLAALPGIGRSTANAIADFCFAARLPILDGNVKRVLCRCFGIDGFPGEAAVAAELWRLAAALLPEAGVDCYIQAQMDLGATLCIRHGPGCAACPLASGCVARREGRVAEMPRARTRKELPEREARVLLLVDGDAVLLERRPPTGVWGGLLALPEIDAAADPARRIADFGYAAPAFAELAPVRHSFTHFHLTLRPLLARVAALATAREPALVRLPLAEIAAAALPAPIRRLLENLAAAAAP